MNTDLPKELLAALTPQTIASLQNISQLRLIRHIDDASGAISSGAVLLAIAENKNTEDGDPFWCLIGLPKGTSITPNLGNFFSRE